MLEFSERIMIILTNYPNFPEYKISPKFIFLECLQYSEVAPKTFLDD